MEISLNSGWGIVGTRTALSRSVDRVYQVAEAVERGDVSSARMVDLMRSEHDYAANARVMHSYDKDIGFLLNVKR